MTDDFKITLELQFNNAVFKIEGDSDLESLAKGVSKVNAFIKENKEKFSKFEKYVASVPHDSGTAAKGSQIEDRRKKKPVLDFRFPAWFDRKNSSIPQAIGIILYGVEYPVSSKDITRLITKQWKPVNLHNVSKYLTSTSSQLYSYIRKDPATKGYYFTAEGKIWFKANIIQKISKI